MAAEDAGGHRRFSFFRAPAPLGGAPRRANGLGMRIAIDIARGLAYLHSRKARRPGSACGRPGRPGGARRMPWRAPVLPVRVLCGRACQGAYSAVAGRAPLAWQRAPPCGAVVALRHSAWHATASRPPSTSCGGLTGVCRLRGSRRVLLCTLCVLDEVCSPWARGSAAADHPHGYEVGQHPAGARPDRQDCGARRRGLPLHAPRPAAVYMSGPALLLQHGRVSRHSVTARPFQPR
jgi:hypothetical protein